MAHGGLEPAIVENPDGGGAFVIVCDHASRIIPSDYDLQLPAEALESHIAWDPGALGVARALSASLDAPLLWPDVSRLVIDCNRPPSAPDLIVTAGEGRPVPGNRDLSDAERAERVAAIHVPYHAAIDRMIERRLEDGRTTALVAVHSFTPTWFGAPRPWQIGILFGDDRRLADGLLGQLSADPSLTVGVNQPYSPADRVYYTLDRHATPRGLPAVMIEIRNDVIADEAGQRQWAERLAAIFADEARTEPAGGVVA